jgi:hypothetical protein
MTALDAMRPTSPPLPPARAGSFNGLSADIASPAVDVRFLRGLCCKTLFVSPVTDIPGRGRGNRILMWGTTSFCDELTDDFRGAFEATSIDGCRLFCRLAEILPQSVLGLLQHNRRPSGNLLIG